MTFSPKKFIIKNHLPRVKMPSFILNIFFHTHTKFFIGNLSEMTVKNLRAPSGTGISSKNTALWNQRVWEFNNRPLQIWTRFSRGGRLRWCVQDPTSPVC